MELLDGYVAELPSDDVLPIQYEQLAEATDSTLRQICGFLETPFDDRMRRFQDFSSHVFGGNPGPVQQGRKHRADKSSSPAGGALAVDERWRQELTRQDLDDFEQAAGKCNRALGYV